MRIGVCTNINVCKGIKRLSVPAEGMTYVEPAVGDLLCPAAAAAAFEERLAAAQAAGVPTEAANCFFPGDLKTTGPDVDADALDAWVRTTCRRAAAAGVTRIVFGSGGSRRVPDGFDYDRACEQLVASLKRFGPIADDCGVVIVLEPLNSKECNIVTSVAEGAELVRAADHPNIRLLADTYHMARDGEGPDSILRAGELIQHVHCAEGDGRGPLGATGEDQRAVFRALKDIGYDQRISIECRWEDFEAQLPEAIAEVRRQWETA